MGFHEFREQQLSQHWLSDRNHILFIDILKHFLRGLKSCKHQRPMLSIDKCICIFSWPFSFSKQTEINFMLCGRLWPRLIISSYLTIRGNAVCAIWQMITTINQVLISHRNIWQNYALFNWKRAVVMTFQDFISCSLLQSEFYFTVGIGHTASC